MKKYSRYQVATAIAILFHAIGLAGILFINKDLFIRTTPYHLLLMGILLFYTAKKINLGFLIFFLLCATTGIGVEIIGTSTGALFGDYMYGTVLGPMIKNVPLILGINWFIIIYCAGATVHSIFSKLSQNTGEQHLASSPLIKALSVIIDGATLAVFFDFILEPAAVKLGYWQWLTADIPLFNYTCWIFVSALLLTAFYFLPFPKNNKFAVHLLLIQLMFFMLIRVFL